MKRHCPAKHQQHHVHPLNHDRFDYVKLLTSDRTRVRVVGIVQQVLLRRSKTVTCSNRLAVLWRRAFRSLLRFQERITRKGDFSPFEQSIALARQIPLGTELVTSGPRAVQTNDDFKECCGRPLAHNSIDFDQVATVDRADLTSHDDGNDCATPELSCPLSRKIPNSKSRDRMSNPPSTAAPGYWSLQRTVRQSIRIFLRIRM